jgi:hypothetical protein
MTQHHPDAYYGIQVGTSHVDIFDAKTGTFWSSHNGCSSIIKGFNVSGSTLVIYYEADYEGARARGDVFDLNTRQVLRSI